MEVENHYLSLPKKYIAEDLDYPNKKLIGVKLPAMINIVGATGSGKTNVMIDLVQKINRFDCIYLYAKDLKEPLYARFIDQMLEVQKKTNVQVLFYSDDIKNMIPVNAMDKIKSNLVIVDDMICENKKDLTIVEEYFIRARKVPATCVFITQSYYKTPALIRQNTGYLILKKLNTKKDLSRVLGEYSVGVDRDQLEDLYDYSTSGAFTNFFMIDLIGDKNQRFRKCYTPIPWTAEDGASDEVVPISQPAQKRKRKEENLYDSDTEEEIKPKKVKTTNAKKSGQFSLRIPPLY
jgi:uncharacterized protein YkvS